MLPAAESKRMSPHHIATNGEGGLHDTRVERPNHRSLESGHHEIC